MTRTNVVIGVAVIAAVAMSVGCGNGNEQPASESAPAAASPAESAQASTDITLRTNPDPVRTGEKQVTMVGNWDVTVMVIREGREIGSKKVTLTAK